MDTYKRQALRLKVLQTICKNVNYAPNVTFFTEKVFKEEPEEIMSFINSSLIYLMQEGYITGNTVKDRWNNEQVINGKITSNGIKLIEYLETNRFSELENISEYSEATGRTFIKVINSNLIIDSQNVIIGNNNESN